MDLLGTRVNMGKRCGLTNEEGGQDVDGVIRHKLFWGWCLLFIGMIQLTFAAAGLVALLTVGIHSITLVFLIGATAATIISRLLYHGRPNPTLQKGKKPGLSPSIRNS